ncbi:hypothetical protein PRZ48_014911 [Zasmidium cellare]|uniref:Uncharacterized protein n=1 Tax=Zasmidium cellare TaxID=395010 RepID=A0ABR0DX26_ZASCE|nr:hypothetical protein PRZ48_014911 [Zasmidium cellare]
MVEIQQRQDPRESFLSALSSLSSAESAESAAATSASIEQQAPSLDVPTGTSTGVVDGPTVPASSNGGDAPSTTAFESPTQATDVSSSSSNSTAALNGNSASNGGSGGGLSEGAKIGLGVGLGVGLSLLLALIAGLCLMRRRKRRQAQMGKYTPQAQSDLSMIEAPGAMATAQNRELPRDHYEPPKQYDDYNEYEPPHQHNVFETPISQVAPSEIQIPAPRSVPDAPPVLTIPTPDRSPLHSIVPSIVPSPEHGASPVSPVSISPVSPIGSRAPSPKPGQ